MGPVLVLRHRASARLFSQWQHKFHWKLHCHWLKAMRQCQIVVVIHGTGSLDCQYSLQRWFSACLEIVMSIFPLGVANGTGHRWWPGLVITGAKTLPINITGGELYANCETHMFVCVKCITALFTWLRSFVILMHGKLLYLNISSVTRVNFISFLTTDLLNNNQLI